MKDVCEIRNAYKFFQSEDVESEDHLEDIG